MHILAALYHLGAHRTPVTAKVISNLLKLHRGNEAPGNVHASLRKYTAYAEVAGEEQPYRWMLTRRGLEQLRTLSGLALASAASESDFQTDVAFICALRHPEYQGLLQAFGGEQKWADASTPSFCHLCQTAELLTASNKTLKVVATVATSMGLTAAAIATTHVIFQYRPRIVVMVGIAAGTRSGNKQFGDVLVADPSVDYNSGKVVLEGGIREFLPDPYPIGLNPRLRNLLQKYQRPNAVFDEIRGRWHGAVPSEPNRVHVGPLGAADQVIDDATRILEIQRNWRKLIGVEMEAYGVYRACHEAPEPKPRFVSMKSVCDFAAEKSDSWQEFASFTAAEFAVAFLRAEWDALWPKT